MIPRLFNTRENDYKRRLTSDLMPPTVSWSDLPEELYISSKFKAVDRDGVPSNTHEFRVFLDTEQIGTLVKTINRKTQVYFGRRRYTVAGEKPTQIFAYREEAVAFMYYGYRKYLTELET